MCIATTAAPAANPARPRTLKARRPTGRLVLVIGARAYRLMPYAFDGSARLTWEWKHVLIGPEGRQFAVYEPNMDAEEARAPLDGDDDRRRRHHCEACGRGECDHVAALIELGLL